MIRGPVLRALAVDEDNSTLTDAHGLPDQMPLPALDERVNFYLRAVYGDREFTNEEYGGARNLLLQAMAADIAARSSTRSPEGASLLPQFPADVERERLTAFADDRVVEDSREAEWIRPHGSQAFPGRRLLPFFSAGQVSNRIAAVCVAAAFAALAGYWMIGIFPALWLNRPSQDSRVAVRSSPPEPSGRTPPGFDRPVMAEVQREVASALSTARLDPDEIAALLKHGQELIADGKFRFARSVLGRAAEAGSAPAAFALGRTYDPILLETSRVPPDAPPDIAMARAWYGKAKDLGSAEAARRLGQLPAAIPAPAARPSPK